MHAQTPKLGGLSALSVGTSVAYENDVALFSRFRRGQSRARDEGPEPAGPPVMEDLEEYLGEIAKKAEAPEDAIEPALVAIVESTGACAGAICLYDVRQCLLRLTAEVGLSDEGCQRLRTVRRADPACWDMPLHGLLNRRAYLIESAAKNRYVPKLVEKKTIASTIVCLPLYAHATPLGSIILVAASPRTFDQRDIKRLWGAVKALSRMIEEVRRQASLLVASSPRPEPTQQAVIEQTAMAVERDSLRSLLSRKQAERERLAGELESQTGTISRMREELEASIADRDELRKELNELESEPKRGGSRRLTAKVTRLEAERDELRSTLAEAKRAGGDIEAEHAVAQAGLRELEGAQARVRELEAGEAERHEAAQGASSEAVHAAEEQARELEQLRARLAEVEADGEQAVARERERLVAELEVAHEREAELQQAVLEATEKRTTETEALQQAQHETRAAEAASADTEAAVAAVRAELQGAVEQSEGLTTELTSARAEMERLRAHHETATGEVSGLTSDLEQLRRDGETQHAEVDSLRVTVETITAERDELRVAVEQQAQSDAARAELESSLSLEREERVRFETEVTRLEAELAAERAAEPVHDDGSQQDIEKLRAEYEAVVAERDALRVERESAPAGGLNSAAITIETEAFAAPSSFDEDLSVEDPSVTVISVPPEPSGPPVEHSTEPVVAIIDGSEAWAGIELAGHKVLIVPPESDTAAVIAAADPVRIIANLSAGSLNALGVLRKAGCTARFWGVVADPDQNYGIPIGVVEPVIPPLDPDIVIGKLGDYVKRGARIVTVGADVDALMSLRQALARKKVSVSMAWDASQAIDLIQQMRPDALVIDLDLPKQDGYRLVTEAIVGIEPAPFTILVGGRAKSGDGFLGALRRRPSQDGQLPVSELLSTLARSIELLPGDGERRISTAAPFGSRGGRG